MHAVTVSDGALDWAARPEPVPGPGEILVAVQAAGVNAADLLQRQGLYPAPPGVPADIPGLELAGEVVGLGPGSTRFGLGDRVMAVVGGGAQAELAVLNETHALAVPPDLSWTEAGGFPEAFSTAYDALCVQCALQLGDRVLVTGAAGGVGSAGVQIAASAGAHVVASVRDSQMHDAVAGLGAAVVVDPADALDHGPFDVVLELVCGPRFSDSLRALAAGGRMAVIGIGGGARPEIDLLTLMQRRARISGSTLRARPSADKALLAGAIGSQVVPLLAAGRIGVPVAATFSLADAELAYERFAAGSKLGKVVLVR